jgi:undecaprenyl pyrophosphate phosphatase UppP
MKNQNNFKEENPTLSYKKEEKMFWKIILLIFVILMGIIGVTYFYSINQPILIIATIGVGLVFFGAILSWILNSHGRRRSRRRR